MNLESLPGTYIYENRKCSLSVLYEEDLGWTVSYMYLDWDPLGMDFYPTLQEAIDALCEKLDLKPEIITPEYLESQGYHKSEEFGLERWMSGDYRVEITKLSNMKNRDWHVHIDNEDFQTIGGLSIQEVWQLEEILRLTEIKR